MADLIDLDGINAKVIERDVIKANVSSVIQKVKPETEEITVTPKTETQVIEPTKNKLINKVNVEAVTAAIDPDIAAENIKTGVNILGKNGTFTNDATAIAEDILQDKIAYVKGEKVVGTLVPEELIITPTEEEQVFTGLFDKVNVEGVNLGIKQFATDEEMQADETAKVGDIAIVNNETLEDLVVGKTYQGLFLPKTIVFDTPITGSKYIYFDENTSTSTSKIYAQVMASRIRFYVNYDDVRTAPTVVKYTSTDGLTYTRSDNNAESLTVYEITGNKYTTITVQETNFELLSQMFKGYTLNFTGLYEYKENNFDSTKMYVCNISDLEYTWHTDEAYNMITDITLNKVSDKVFDGEILSKMVEVIKTAFPYVSDSYINFFFNNNDELCFLLPVLSGSYSGISNYLVFNRDSGGIAGIGFESAGGINLNGTLYKADLDTLTYEEIGTYEYVYPLTYRYIPITDIKTVPVKIYNNGNIYLNDEVYSANNTSLDIVLNESPLYIFDGYVHTNSFKNYLAEKGL